MVVKKFKVKVSDMRSTLNNIEEKIRPISDSVVTDYFAEDLLPLVTIADKVEMGKKSTDLCFQARF